MKRQSETCTHTTHFKFAMWNTQQQRLLSRKLASQTQATDSTHHTLPFHVTSRRISVSFTERTTTFSFHLCSRIGTQLRCIEAQRLIAIRFLPTRSGRDKDSWRHLVHVLIVVSWNPPPLVSRLGPKLDCGQCQRYVFVPFSLGLSSKVSAA